MSLTPLPLSLEERVAAIERYLTSQNAAWNVPPLVVPVGSTGSMTLTPLPLSPVGYVTPRTTDGANVRSARIVMKDTFKYTLAYGDTRRVLGKQHDGGYLWYALEDGNYVREDAVTFSEDAPAPVLPPSGRWKPPVSPYTITNRHTVNGHRGIDFAASHGLPVWCGPRGGAVVKAALCPKCNAQGTPRIREVSNNFGYGHYVIVRYAPDTLPLSLQQGQYLFVIYAHLSAIGVSAGETLHDEDVLGFVGSTGDSTGPHLHVEARLSADANAKWGLIAPQEIDPALLFEV